MVVVASVIAVRSNCTGSAASRSGAGGAIARNWFRAGENGANVGSGIGWSNSSVVSSESSGKVRRIWYYSSASVGNESDVVDVARSDQSSSGEDVDGPVGADLPLLKFAGGETQISQGDADFLPFGRVDGRILDVFGMRDGDGIKISAVVGQSDGEVSVVGIGSIETDHELEVSESSDIDLIIGSAGIEQSTVDELQSLGSLVDVRRIVRDIFPSSSPGVESNLESIGRSSEEIQSVSSDWKRQLSLQQSSVLLTEREFRLGERRSWRGDRSWVDSNSATISRAVGVDVSWSIIVIPMDSIVVLELIAFGGEVHPQDLLSGIVEVSVHSQFAIAVDLSEVFCNPGVLLDGEGGSSGVRNGEIDPFSNGSVIHVQSEISGSLTTGVEDEVILEHGQVGLVSLDSLVQDVRVGVVVDTGTTAIRSEIDETEIFQLVESGNSLGVSFIEVVLVFIDVVSTDVADVVHIRRAVVSVPAWLGSAARDQSSRWDNDLRSTNSGHRTISVRQSDRSFSVLPLSIEAQWDLRLEPVVVADVELISVVHLVDGRQNSWSSLRADGTRSSNFVAEQEFEISEVVETGVDGELRSSVVVISVSDNGAIDIINDGSVSSLEFRKIFEWRVSNVSGLSHDSAVVESRSFSWELSSDLIVSEMAAVDPDMISTTPDTEVAVLPSGEVFDDSWQGLPVISQKFFLAEIASSSGHIRQNSIKSSLSGGKSGEISWRIASQFGSSSSELIRARASLSHGGISIDTVIEEQARVGSSMGGISAEDSQFAELRSSEFVDGESDWGLGQGIPVSEGSSYGDVVDVIVVGRCDPEDGGIFVGDEKITGQGIDTDVGFELVAMFESIFQEEAMSNASETDVVGGLEVVTPMQDQASLESVVDGGMSQIASRNISGQMEMDGVTSQFSSLTHVVDFQSFNVNDTTGVDDEMSSPSIGSGIG